MEHGAMLCPACAGSLEVAQSRFAFLPFRKSREIRCGHCGKTTAIIQAKVMGEAFTYWCDQFAHQVEASLAYLPELTREECFTVLNPRHFDDEVHAHIKFKVLLHYLCQVFRPVLRDKSLGFEDASLSIGPIKHNGIPKALGIFGHCGHHQHSHDSEAWTLLITRLGNKGFLTYLMSSSPHHNGITIEGFLPLIGNRPASPLESSTASTPPPA